MKVVSINSRKKFNRKKIAQDAWYLVQKFGAEFGHAMRIAWKVAKGELDKFYMISFTKKNGELTTRFFTDYSNYNTYVRFYDLGKDGYSSAVKFNIHKTLVITVTKTLIENQKVA